MKRKVTSPRLSVAQTAYVSEVVAAITDFALSSGLPLPLLKTLVEQRIAHQVKTAGTTVRSGKAAGRSTYVVAPNMLYRWHKNLRLLDDLGNPKPLPLRGAAPSVEALIRAEKPRDSIEAVIKFLQKARLIRRRGKGWAPPAAEVIMNSINPAVVEHSTRTVLRFLETINHNLRHEVPAARLIERSVVAADFPPEAMAEFRAFVHDHGADFLTTVDNWMGSRAARFAPAATTGRRSRARAANPEVGVHLFAWVQTPPAA
ncbi:MAG: DUF6502 family protein [Proteobacteria bacterium]|nr:DUF6502 family protein [Pseudomonadota bacterium]